MRADKPRGHTGAHGVARLPASVRPTEISQIFSRLFPVSFIQISHCRCLSSESVTTGDPSGWCERLYHAKASELILYGRALGLSHSEAEDVLQETFVALMQRAEPPTLPEHYSVRAFRNRALNYRRSLWRRFTRELESHRWFERSPAESPFEREAMGCLAELPPDQREVIVLKIWHQHTFEEIGELLEISPNTAAGRYRYGLQKLRACLKGAAYERDERFGNTIALVGAPPPLA